MFCTVTDFLSTLVIAITLRLPRESVAYPSRLFGLYTQIYLLNDPDGDTIHATSVHSAGKYE